MKLVTLDRGPSGQAGVVIDDLVLDISKATSLMPLAAWIPSSVRRIIVAGDEGLGLVRRLIDAIQGHDRIINQFRETGALTPLESTRLRAPMPRPGILLSHGRAYHSHVQEMKAGDKAPAEPIGFMKNVNAIIGTGAPIILPSPAATMVDFEAEISVVFGRACHGVSAEQAMSYVLGFTIVNDVSARNWVGDIARNPELNRMGKQFATFAPMGPCIATCDEIDDTNNLRLTTRLNGELMQDASTRDLIWSLPDLIAYYARWYPFQPGDVMTTGTPSGVGFGRDPKVFLKPGDVVSIAVEGVGTLTNPVIAET